MLTCNLRVFIIGLENHPVKCYTGISYYEAYINVQIEFWHQAPTTDKVVAAQKMITSNWSKPDQD